MEPNKIGLQRPYSNTKESTKSTNDTGNWHLLCILYNVIVNVTNTLNVMICSKWKLVKWTVVYQWEKAFEFAVPLGKGVNVTTTQQICSYLLHHNVFLFGNFRGKMHAFATILLSFHHSFTWNPRRTILINHWSQKLIPEIFTFTDVHRN